MSQTRRFLVASSLARLIRKERGGSRVTEGYFPNQADRSSYVYLDGEQSSLVLITTGAGMPVEERTDVPRAHAEALLDVTPGKVDYVRSTLTVGTHDIRVSRFVTPGPFDLVSVEFERDEDAREFRAPSWFGPEVTADQAYYNRSIALSGLPQAPEIPLTNAALNTLLDIFENRYAAPRTHGNLQQRPDAERQDTARQDTARQDTARPDSGEDAQRRAASPHLRPSAPQAGEAATTVEVESSSDEIDRLNLNIEDNVIRELARSLRPQRK
jgi:CYTH domain-containing protein